MVEISKSRNPFVDLVQVAFIVTDAHSKILYANRYTKRLFGYGREEIEGQRIRTLFLEEDLTYFLPNIIYLSLYKNGFEGEALLRQKDGTKVFTHLYTTTFKEGGEIFISFSFQEIQRLKKLERMSQRLEEYILFPKPTFRKERIEKVLVTVLQTASEKAAEKGVFFILETRALEGRGDFFIDRDLIPQAA